MPVKVRVLAMTSYSTLVFVAVGAVASTTTDNALPAVPMLPVASTMRATKAWVPSANVVDSVMLFVVPFQLPDVKSPLCTE